MGAKRRMFQDFVGNAMVCGVDAVRSPQREKWLAVLYFGCQKLSESGSFSRRPRCERSLSRSAQFSLVNANLRCFRPMICYHTHILVRAIVSTWVFVK